MTEIPVIKMDDYDYELPTYKIATQPLPLRDASKLLVYNHNKIIDDVYSNIAQYIAPQSLLVFNNTKVIQARIIYTKHTGGTIELFVLGALGMELATAMNSTNELVIQCYIGGASKWKPGVVLSKVVHILHTQVTVDATLLKKDHDTYQVHLQWHNNTINFGTLLTVLGQMPLPPYIKRAEMVADKERYQTIYAKHNGSVAAPTAGLHFTTHIMEQLTLHNIHTTEVTLHVGAGTFKPVQSSTINEHNMHVEYIHASITSIQAILLHSNAVIAVGTTSLRTIESLYWLGVKVLALPSLTLNQLIITQWDAYLLPQHYTTTQSLQALSTWLIHNTLDALHTTTQLLIVPTYEFKVAKALVTNFHQPCSTLLLLVAAATKGNWKQLYTHALANEYRFLSYGDGSLIYF